MESIHVLPPPGWVKPRLYHLISPLVALLVVWGLNETTTLIQKVENLTVSLRFTARSTFDPPADPRLVFVGIDEPSLNALGRWPWPRTDEAQLLAEIAKAGAQPSVVAFDLMFTEATNKEDKNAAVDPNDPDNILGNATALLPAVITGAYSISDKELIDPDVRDKAEKETQRKLNDAGPTQALSNLIGDVAQLHGSKFAALPIDPIRKQSLFGFVNDEPSFVDDIRHTVPLVFRVGTKVYPSLALQALCQALSVDPDKVEINLTRKYVRLTNISGKEWTIPTNERAEFSINYRRQTNFQSVGVFGLIQNLDEHNNKNTPIAPACDVDKKILVVGEAAVALGDMGPTPLASRTPLPFVHLNVINNVLKNDYLTFVPWCWVVFGWAVITWPTLLRLKDAFIGEAILVPIAIQLFYIIAAFAIFWLWSIQIDLAWPVISYTALNFGGIVLRWREERQGRQQIKQIFARMVAPEIMDHLLEHPEGMALGGSNRESTVLFSDIRGFTEFSEGLDSEEVMRQLNVYFERMVACVTERKGTLHKFIGDAIMAAWGDIEQASLGPKADARNAVLSTLLMRSRLRVLNEERKEEGLVPIRIGVGLNFGMVQAGMLGSSGRMEFTVIGDAVNTASRLEGATKEFKTDTAISQSVRDLLGDEFLVRRLGLIQLKGKSEALMVYEVLAAKDDMGDSRMSAGGVERYEEAFDHFLARRFDRAVEGFIACEKDYPTDYCIQIYLKASREFLTEPPPPEWDGRIVMETK
jgi:adenylate cyclase